jgi:hypothetical protein
MKLLRYFKYFLEETVNLNQSRIDILDKRVETLETFLLETSEIAEDVTDFVRQGSYAHKTIIRPVAGRDFDADVLLQFDEQAGWEPSAYVVALYSAFRQSATYKEMVRRRARCVTVQYADGFHVDVVPYLERAGGSYITNRDENRFELTNPEGYSDWVDQQNRTTAGHFIEVIRLVKYLRDFKTTFSAKSVLLTTMLGSRVNSAHLLGDPGYYADMPTALLHIVGDLDDYLQANPTMPVITDPSCPSQDFNHRWDQAEYANFRNQIHRYAGWISDAFTEADRDKSLVAWQRIFGDGFQQPPMALSEAAKASSATDTEEFLERDHNIPIVRPSAHTVRISARTPKRKGFRHGKLSARGNRVSKNTRVKFTIEGCSVPEPYAVYWKVKNAGAEATAADCLRGQIVKDDGSASRTEPTAYRGSHYVECYIVKNGECLAIDRQPVFVL